MNTKDIEVRVRRVLAEQLACEVDEVTLDASFEKDLDADSLNRVEAVVALEEEFGVTIAEDEMARVKTVRHAVDLAAAKLDAGT